MLLNTDLKGGRLLRAQLGVNVEVSIWKHLGCNKHRRAAQSYSGGEFRRVFGLGFASRGETLLPI